MGKGMTTMVTFIFIVLIAYLAIELNDALDRRR
jgi:hypothetical protein